MEARRVPCVLVLILCLVHYAYTGCTAEGGCSKLWKPPRNTHRSTAPKDLQKTEKVRYEVCAQVGSTIYYCRGDGICCTPGSPTSKCCPADHPLCITQGIKEVCCVQGYPKLCGAYCCTSDSYCCDDKNCCASEEQCCGSDQCCLEQTPCCTGPDKKQQCCDKDKMACCGSTYGCVSPCQCPFDAIGCAVASAEDNEKQSENLDLIDGPPQVTCPSPATTNTLYRILRSDENCDVGLIAKDPSQTKDVLSHVNCGSRKNYKSQFISFSSSMEVANFYKDKFGPGLQIATVNLGEIPAGRCEVIDLTTAQNRDFYLGKAVCKNFAKASCEVLLSCGTARVQCTTESNTPIIRDASVL